MTKPHQQSVVSHIPIGENDTRPGLAIVTNSITPYQVNLDRSIAAGIPELKLHVLVTHGAADFNWEIEIPPEIHLERFGAAGEHSRDNPLRRPIWGWRKGGRLIRHFRANNVRAAIFCGFTYISYARLINYCYRTSIPFFVNTDNNIRSERRLSALKSFAKRRVYAWWTKRAAGVLSMGKLGDQYFVKYGADPRRLYRVPYWPDFDAFTDVDQIGLDRFRRKFGLELGRRYLLYSGRLVRDKRVDLLIDAFGAIAAQRPEWDLLIVGDGPLRDELQRRVPAAVRRRVVWTGFLEGRQLASAYHASDVLLLPSDQENWAVVVQEAMAAGLVVIASDVVGAAHELVADGVSGRIFLRGDCDSLRQSLEDVTLPDRIDRYKSETTKALRRYREVVNPIAEIRRALCDVGLLSPVSASQRSLKEAFSPNEQ